jgi:uncharacterized protein (DUF58 family)
MRTVLSLVVWLILAAIGIDSAGFWGFLGVAFLYVLYYGLLRPRVTVHVTPQQLEEQRARDATTKAVLLDKAAKTLNAFSRADATATPPIQEPEPIASLDDIKSVDDRPYWDCTCRTRNESRRWRCRKCGAPNPQ